MPNHKKLKPFVKWAGGKTRLLPVLLKHFPDTINCYIEPFVGGGAVFLHLLEKPNRKAFSIEKYHINDANQELITAYKVVERGFKRLLSHLKGFENDKEFFYEVRSWDRKTSFKSLSDEEKTARFLYLNKTCFNGLYRVNRKGFFNTPFGHYKNPNFINEVVLEHVSQALNEAQVYYSNKSFYGHLMAYLSNHHRNNNCFVYLDPPYHSEDATSSFTSYTSQGFGIEQQIKLRQACDALNAAGIKFLLSSSATAFIRSLYQNYKIIEVEAPRSIAASPKSRGKAKELIIKNY